MTASADDSIARFFNDDSFAKHCKIELVSVEPGRAVARMPLAPFHLNGYEVVQGGAIFTLADFAFAAASNSHGAIAVAINVSITFIKAATSGTLLAEAREVARNAKLGTYSIEVRDDQGNVVAHFQGLAYRKNQTIADWYKQRS